MRNKRGSEVLSSIQQPCRSGWRTGGALGGGGQYITPGVMQGRSGPGSQWYQPMPSPTVQAAMPWLQSRLRLYPKINQTAGRGDAEAVTPLF